MRIISALSFVIFTILQIRRTFCRTSDSTYICDSDQAWDGVQCIDCATGCSCDSTLLQGNCDACLDTYVEYNPTKASVTLGSTVCLSCSPECGDTCCFNYSSSVMVCTECPDSYYLSTWFCQQCLDPNCKTCSDNGACTTCLDGYFLNSSEICQSCSGTNCVTCDSSGSCATCPSGYYVDSSGNCSACTKNGTAASGCVTCNSSSTTKCKVCSDYMYLDGQGKCRTVAYCDNITAVGEICNSCTDGYYLNSSGKCAACPQTGAARCSSASNLIQCTNDKALTSDGSACVSKISHCKEYNTSGLCTTCDSNALWLGSGQCYTSCTSAISNCSTCVNGSATADVTCSACASGYFLDATSTSCISCSDNNNGGLTGCATCSASLPFSCSSCSSGYYYSSGTCTGCTPDLKGTGCSTCSNASTCSTCLTNSFTSSGTCNLCDVSCATCTDRGYQNCLTCASDYYYLANTTDCNKCNVAMPGCTTCSSDTTCTLCYNSYFLSSDPSLVGTSSQCQRFVGCKLKSAGLKCLLCKPGYALTYNGCVQCRTQDCEKACVDESNVIVIGAPLSFGFSIIVFIVTLIMVL